MLAALLQFLEARWGWFGLGGVAFVGLVARAVSSGSSPTGR